MKLAVDIIVQRGDELLFIRRKFAPFQGELALPGGLVEDNETVEAAACRELAEETSIQVEESRLRLVGVFSAPQRDPRSRVVSIVYHVEVPLGTEAHAGDDAAAYEWVVKAAVFEEELAFDHRFILEQVL